MSIQHQCQPVESWRGESFPTKVLLAGCRHIPYFRGKGRIFQWLAASILRGKLQVRNSHGARLRIDPSDYIGRTISYEGAFEPKSLALATAIMRDGGVFLDVGCNFGLYTMTLGVLPGVECIAIDGSFVALAMFQENRLLNPQIKIHVVNAALCGENRLLCFEVPPRNLGKTHVTDVAHDEGRPSQFWASGVVLERVLERLTPSRIKLLKIDVEGSEMSVFQGLDFNGPYRPENLIVECCMAFPQAIAVFEYLQSKGYEAMTVDGKLISECKDLPEDNVWFRSSNH